jgi:hypothetical protein
MLFNGLLSEILPLRFIKLKIYQVSFSGLEEFLLLQAYLAFCIPKKSGTNSKKPADKLVFFRAQSKINRLKHFLSI